MLEALRLTATWPVPHVAAAAIDASGDVHVIGDTSRSFRLASVTKPLTAWAVLVAVEEGTVSLDDEVGQPGCTLRHLLAHAGGYAFDGDAPITRPRSRRIYSNTGIELAAAHVAAAAAMPFEQYLAEAVLQPLSMSATALRGSPAHGAVSTVDDLVAFGRELRSPTLISAATAADATSVQFPELSGIVPGIGRFDPCPWGLGSEIRGSKQPHWTGARCSPATFGHFGGAGTFMWVDPGVSVAVVALTDRAFDQWAPVALQRWPELSDAVLDELTA